MKNFAQWLYELKWEEIIIIMAACGKIKNSIIRINSERSALKLYVHTDSSVDQIHSLEIIIVTAINFGIMYFITYVWQQSF